MDIMADFHKPDLFSLDYMEFMDFDTSYFDLPNSNTDSIFGEIAREIEEDQVFTISQLQLIMNSNSLLAFFLTHFPPLKIDYRLDDEFEMSKTLIDNFSKGKSFISFFLTIIFPKCTEDLPMPKIFSQFEEQSKILENRNKIFELLYETIKANLNNPDYSDLLENFIRQFPNYTDFWLLVFDMETNFKGIIITLLQMHKYPPNKKIIIEKIQSYTSYEDILILTLLELTSDEFNECKAQDFLMEIIHKSLNSPKDGDAFLLFSHAFKYISQIMCEKQFIYSQFFDLALEILDHGNMKQKQEILKFLWKLLSEIPELVGPIIVSSNIIEMLLDQLDSLFSSSEFKSLLSILVKCLEIDPENTLRHIDYSSVIDSLTEIHDSMDDPLLDQIYNLLTKYHNNEE